jgi:hypothetical protein
VRAALLVLLLVNLAFFAWSSWLAPKEAALPASPKVDAKRLQLASEAQPMAADGSCVTVGPFATTELAARAQQTLTDSGYSSVSREVVISVPSGFWVYLEAPSTEAGERRMLERLRRGGITDAAVVGDAGSRRISLGVFNEETRAFTRSEAVARLNLLPQIVAQEKSSTVFWLDLSLKTGAPPLEGEKFKAGDAELEFRPCPAGAGAAGTTGAAGAGPQGQNPAAS